MDDADGRWKMKVRKGVVMADQKISNQALEEAIAAFANDREKDNYVKVMELLEKSIVLMPAMPPQNLDPETEKQMRAGKPVQLTGESRIVPCLLRKESGEQALPIFSSAAQIPPDKKSPTVLALPFFACVSMAMANQEKIEAVVLNPFTQNMVLNKSILEVADKRRKQLAELVKQGQTGQKTIQVSEKQFQDLVHNRVALMLLPKYLFAHKEEGLKKLQKEEGEFLLQFYDEVYPEGRKPSYRADDFSVMTLNITETVQLTRVDMPDEVVKKGMCYRIYAVWKRDTEEVVYYVLEQTKDGNFIAQVTPDGKHEVIEPAPDNGAEIEAVMGLVAAH